MIAKNRVSSLFRQVPFLITERPDLLVYKRKATYSDNVYLCRTVGLHVALNVLARFIEGRL